MGGSEPLGSVAKGTRMIRVQSRHWALPVLETIEVNGHGKKKIQCGLGHTVLISVRPFINFPARYAVQQQLWITKRAQ